MRLKRNVTWLGRSQRGFNIYSFQYVWGGPTYVGVLAQEVLKRAPDAVTRGGNGFLMVDYSKVDVPMMTLDAWRAARHQTSALHS